MAGIDPAFLIDENDRKLREAAIQALANTGPGVQNFDQVATRALGDAFQIGQHPVTQALTTSPARDFLLGIPQQGILGSFNQNISDPLGSFVEDLNIGLNEAQFAVQGGLDRILFGKDAKTQREGPAGQQGIGGVGGAADVRAPQPVQQEFGPDPATVASALAGKKTGEVDEAVKGLKELEGEQVDPFLQRFQDLESAIAAFGERPEEETFNLFGKTFSKDNALQALAGGLMSASRALSGPNPGFGNALLGFSAGAAQGASAAREADKEDEKDRALRALGLRLQNTRELSDAQIAQATLAQRDRYQEQRLGLDALMLELRAQSEFTDQQLLDLRRQEFRAEQLNKLVPFRFKNDKGVPDTISVPLGQQIQLQAVEDAAAGNWVFPIRDQNGQHVGSSRDLIDQAVLDRITADSSLQERLRLADVKGEGEALRFNLRREAAMQLIESAPQTAWASRAQFLDEQRAMSQGMLLQSFGPLFFDEEIFGR